MIDAESVVFSGAAAMLRDRFSGIWVAGEYTDAPSRFPAVTIIQRDNAIVQRMRTSNIENAVAVMFEVSIFTNTVGTKKQEAKNIMEAVDEYFSSLGFARTMCNPVSNLNDATIYRIVARYEATLDKEYRVYRTN